MKNTQSSKKLICHCLTIKTILINCFILSNRGTHFANPFTLNKMQLYLKYHNYLLMEQ